MSDRKFNATKKRLEKSKIATIENEVRRHHESGTASLKKEIEILYCLKRTGRFRENVAYKKATFFEYINGLLGYTKAQYETLEIAHYLYPEQTARLGAGNVARIYRAVGSGKAREAMETAKSPAPDEIKSVIERYVPPPKKKDRGPTKWDLRSEIDSKDKIIADLQMRLQEHADQDARQRKALLAKDVKIKELSTKLELLQKMLNVTIKAPPSELPQFQMYGTQ